MGQSKIKIKTSFRLKLNAIQYSVLLYKDAQRCSQFSMTWQITNSLIIISVDIDGKYSRSISPFITTFVINRKGTWVSFYPANGTAIYHKLKFNGLSNRNLSMTSENGEKSKITRSDEGVVAMESYDNTFVTKPDNNLEISNMSCK